MSSVLILCIAIPTDWYFSSYFDDSLSFSKWGGILPLFDTTVSLAHRTLSCTEKIVSRIFVEWRTMSTIVWTYSSDWSPHFGVPEVLSLGLWMQWQKHVLQQQYILTSSNTRFLCSSLLKCKWKNFHHLLSTSIINSQHFFYILPRKE